MCTMKKLAGAYIGISGPSPAASALMSHYDRKPKTTPWKRFIESEDTHNLGISESQPHRVDGLSTPLSPTIDAGELTGMRTAVVAKCGRQMGHSPDRLRCTPGRASQAADVLASPGCRRAPMDRGLKRPRDVIDGQTPPRSPASSSTSSSSSRRVPRVLPKMAAKVEMGAAAVKLKSSGTAGRKWLSTFIYDRWGCCPGNCDDQFRRVAWMTPFRW
jgi:hypothetical protein